MYTLTAPSGLSRFRKKYMNFGGESDGKNMVGADWEGVRDGFDQTP